MSRNHPSPCGCTAKNGQVKNAYTDKDAAIHAALRRSRGLTLRLYACPITDGYWHITKQKRGY